MRLLFYSIAILSLLSFTNVQAGTSSSLFEDFLQQQPQAEDELASTEWKKFKYFEDQLNQSSISQKEKEARLTGYAKDSIQILKVKLIAIQVLDQKDLLHRDIQENLDYYSSLLERLRESAIPPSEYLFLEEKLAYLNQAGLQRKLRWSTGMNIGFVALLLIMTISLVYIKKRPDKKDNAVLSKQETLVRNLILQGKSNKEIANELFVSLSTVKSHITSIYAKLNVSDRRELLQNSTGTST